MTWEELKNKLINSKYYYFHTDNGVLLCGDCLKVMKEIPDESVDLVLTDPPFGITKNKWDSILPLNIMWKLLNKITKDNTAIILFSQGKFSARLILSNEKYFRYNLIWDKGDRGSGFLNASRMPLRNHEEILVFYRKQPIYNPQFSEGKPLKSMGTKFRFKEMKNNNYNKFDSRNNPSAKRVGDTRKYPKSIIRFDRPHPPIHPTQKPVALMEYLIKTYSNEGNLVLDFCIGSGTTAVACEKLNRRWMGIEIEEKYCEIAKKRILEVINKKEF